MLRFFYAHQQPYQKFVTIGKIQGDDVYQEIVSDDFKPYRRNIAFCACHEVAIRPLIDGLNFIKNKKSWGYMFRFGFFEIPKEDYDLIAQLMLKEAGI